MIHFEIQFDNGKHYVGQKRGGGYEHHLYRTQNKDILSLICDSNVVTTIETCIPSMYVYLSVLIILKSTLTDQNP